MAVYFLRETDQDRCIGCGDCVERCPVNAVALDPNGRPVVDLDWCIGCGVCVLHCPVEAARLTLRSDRTGQLPAGHFNDLHRMILQEKEVPGRP